MASHVADRLTSVTSGDVSAPACGVYLYSASTYNGFTNFFCNSVRTTRTFFRVPHSAQVTAAEELPPNTVTYTKIITHTAEPPEATDPPGPTTTAAPSEPSEPPAPPAPATMPVGPIVGGVVGGIGTVSCLLPRSDLAQLTDVLQSRHRYSHRSGVVLLRPSEEGPRPAPAVTAARSGPLDAAAVCRSRTGPAPAGHDGQPDSACVR